MTKEEIVGLGEYCDGLLKQDNFTKLIGLFETQTVQHLLNTKPEEKQKREDVFASFNGVRDLLGLMKIYIDAKNEIIAEDQQVPSDDPDALLQED